MSTNPSGWDGADHAPMLIRKFRDFDVSWAGPGRDASEFCFGSEDGRILLTDESLTPTAFLRQSPMPSREAINGLAFINGVIALSSRSEVVFVTQTPLNGKGFRSVFPAGAHGILATASGHAVAPMGRGGVMVVKPSAGEEQPVTIRRVSHKQVNFYKVANIPYAGGEMLACATRYDGMAAMHVSPDGVGSVSSLTYPGLDVVDVCSLGRNLPTPAVAAVGRDCTLILSRDAFDDRTPRAIKFEEIKGTAYRVLSHEGNLLLLTSRAVYVLAGLGRRFLNGEPVELTPTPVKAMVIEAVDANVAGGQWLLVVTPDGTVPVRLDTLIGKTPMAEHVGETLQFSPTKMSPPWQPESNPEDQREMFLAAG